MQMIITEIEYKNIRKIDSLKLKFVDSNEKLIKRTFIMMGNGTGKTTTMTLLKGIFDGSAEGWEKNKVKSFQPLTRVVELGEFWVTTKFDDKIYKYFLKMNYKSGEAKISCSTTRQGGFENKRMFPISIQNLFTTEFVSRFIFDGEQAEKILNTESNEAEETIRYLYRLDMLDEVLEENEKILIDKQRAEGGRAGTDRALNRLRTQQEESEDNLRTLKKRQAKLEDTLDEYQKKKEDVENNLKDVEKKCEELEKARNECLDEKQDNQSRIEKCSGEIVTKLRRPYLANRLLYDRMKALGDNMTRLKLPKNTSKEFFEDLSKEDVCICGNHIGEKEKKIILSNADKYLGSDKQGTLNRIKGSLSNCQYNEELRDKFKELEELDKKTVHINSRLKTAQENLDEAGGEKTKKLKEELDKIKENIAVEENKKRILLNRNMDINNLPPEYTSKTNMFLAEKELKECRENLARQTNTNKALRRKEIVDKLVKKIKERAVTSLKKEIIDKANEKLKKVIDDDVIEIDSIESFIKLKSKNGASEAQTLSVAYCFLGTLFEDSELAFPFIIDSPAGKMDLGKRKAVAEILPTLFNQLICFVTSAEVEQFADRFYKDQESQFITVIAKDNHVEKNYGQNYFDNYQREHREED